MTAFYNEIDPYAAAWLRNLIAAGHIADGIVDERSICDLQPTDVAGFTQVHFFAGIGGWSLAARLAGWPDDRPIWTGSCPCQPFSVAGKGAGFDDPRHLWPEFHRLIAERRPSTIFGEQVTKAADWLGLVRSDLVALDYAVGAIPIEASCESAKTSRPRFFFVADAAGPRGRWRSEMAEGHREEPRRSGEDFRALARPLRTGSSSTLSIADVLQPSYAIPNRVAQLRALGNAIVPQVAAEIIGAYLDCSTSI